MATDEDVDATRRTRLANERTYLAWWRGGLTALAVAFGIGALLPKVSDDGDALAVRGARRGVRPPRGRVHRVRRAPVPVGRAGRSTRGEFAPLDLRVASLLAAFGVVLAVLTIVAVVSEA